MSRSHFAQRLGTDSRPATRVRWVWLMAALPLVALIAVSGIGHHQSRPVSFPAASEAVTASDAPSAISSSAELDIAMALRELDSRRSQALMLRDPALLNDVDAPASPALESDRNAIAALIASDSRIEGLAFDIQSVVMRYSRLSASGEYAGLEVEDARTAYRVKTGGVISEVAPRSNATWSVTLFRADSREPWRYWSSELLTATQRASPIQSSGAAR